MTSALNYESVVSSPPKDTKPGQITLPPFAGCYIKEEMTKETVRTRQHPHCILQLKEMQEPLKQDCVSWLF